MSSATVARCKSQSVCPQVNKCFDLLLIFNQACTTTSKDNNFWIFPWEWADWWLLYFQNANQPLHITGPDHCSLSGYCGNTDERRLHDPVTSPEQTHKDNAQKSTLTQNPQTFLPTSLWFTVCLLMNLYLLATFHIMSGLSVCSFLSYESFVSLSLSYLGCWEVTSFLVWLMAAWTKPLATMLWGDISL